MRKRLPLFLVVLVLPIGGFLLFSLNRPASTHSAQSTAEASTPFATTTGPDADGDGVEDASDRCSTHLPGTSGVDSTGCPTQIDPYVGLQFKNPGHRAWFKRFWYGSCEDVKFPQICFPGSPYWEDAITQAMARVPEVEQGYLRNRMWALGRAGGLNWADTEPVKKITLDYVRQWGNTLLASETPDALLATVTQIEDEVCALIGAVIEENYAEGTNCQ